MERSLSAGEQSASELIGKRISELKNLASKSSS
jgi:hypothetical protein